MRLLNTANAGLTGFLCRAEYEIKHAYPQPASRGGQTGKHGFLFYRWPKYDLSLTVVLSVQKAILWHPRLIQGKYIATAVRESKGVTGLFYMLFDLLGNDDQAFRILTEPYKGP